MSPVDFFCPYAFKDSTDGQYLRCRGSISSEAIFFSATDLNQRKLFKCKQTKQIVTFKVLTLNRIGQLPELTASTVEHKIDKICIQEHRYTQKEDIKYDDTGNGWTLASVSAWKNSVS